MFKRAQNYQNVWDPKTGFMRGKRSDGTWQEPFDPLAWGGPYVEGNAWQWLWSVQQDPYGLMRLLGGREGMAAKLDQLLTMPSTTVNGKPFTRTWLAHHTITCGGLLEFQMGPEPNEKWGSAPSDAQPNCFE